jgi:hypothetical protein
MAQAQNLANRIEQLELRVGHHRVETYAAGLPRQGSFELTVFARLH